jgi:hypothetical protein
LGRAESLGYSHLGTADEIAVAVSEALAATLRASVMTSPIVVGRVTPPAALPIYSIAARDKQGGHNVAKVDVLRRYSRSWRNFLEVYRPLADYWEFYDNAEATPQL